MLAPSANPPGALLDTTLNELVGLHEAVELHEGTGASTDSLIQALNDPESATAIELLLEGLTPADWGVARAIRDAVVTRIWRRPIGNRLTCSRRGSHTLAAPDIENNRHQQAPGAFLGSTRAT